MQIFESCIQSWVHQCMYKNAMDPKTGLLVFPTMHGVIDDQRVNKIPSGLSNYSKEVQLSVSFCKPMRSMNLSRGLTFKS